MMNEDAMMDQLLESLVDSLDIPPSHHERARERYDALGRWFHREGSTVANFEPDVFPQGSFRLGTAIRPLLVRDEYDLDLVCHVRLGKSDTSQKELKVLVGDEVQAYADSNNLRAPPVERKRCWRLDYADKVSFHMDILPAIPNDDFVREGLVKAGVAIDEAANAIAITDNTRPNYSMITSDWPQSNPRGFAHWFEKRMRQGEMRHAVQLVKQGAYASVQDVPAHACKSILQRSVQLLKRHRDIMFRDQCDLKPISIIITTLAGRAYDGRAGLYRALREIVDAMPNLVEQKTPRVRNPVNPNEDFADKWLEDSRLERSFWTWHRRVRQDIEWLTKATGKEDLTKLVRRNWDLSIDEDAIIGNGAIAKGVVSAVPQIHVESGPQPWGDGA